MPQKAEQIVGERSTLLFYCYHNECLEPRALDEMAYGCHMCLRPKLYKELSDDFKQALPVDLRQIWDVRPECPEPRHHLAIVPRCPVCSLPIQREGFHPPIGIWGGVKSGKTVYCAALAQEMEGPLFQQTGLLRQFLVDRSEYKRAVVNPLFGGASGLLPDKNRPDEHRKLVLRLWGGDWPSRSITLTDMAGEIFMPTDTDGDEDLRRRQRTVLWTRESIFLADPEKAAELGAPVRVDLFDVQVALLQLIQDRGIPLGTEKLRVERLVRRREDILRDHDYPSNRGQGDSPFKTLAMELAATVLPPPPDPDLVESIRRCLEDEAKKIDDVPTLQDQIDPVARRMRDWGYRQQDGKLDHRIAITVSKGDVLSELGPGYDANDQIITHPELPEKKRWKAPRQANSRSSPQWWQRPALQEKSNQSREVLIQKGEGKFVTTVESMFAEVGFFFVSSLGRDTEVFVKEGPIRRAVQSSLQAQSPFGGQPQPPQAAGPQVPTWTLGKRVKANPDGGGRAPAPQHVLLPLLWILAGARP